MPEDFEIELDLAAPAEKTTATKDKDGGEGASKAKPQSESKVISQEDLVALQAELTAAKADRDRAKSGETAAQTRATEIERDSQAKLASEVEKRIAEQETTIETALAGAQGEIDSFRTLAAKAMEEGKWTEAAEAQENLTDAKARLRELTRAKSDLGASKERLKTEAAQPKTPSLGSKTQAWIASHPRFNTDSVYRAAALYGHEKAIRAGHAPDSDEYFNLVELETGDRKIETKPDTSSDDEGKVGEGGGGKAPANGESRQSGVAAVQRRTTTTSSTPSRQTIKLSGDQVQAADDLFGDPSNPTLYIKDPKERYTYWHAQQERLKTEGRL